MRAAIAKLDHDLREHIAKELAGSRVAFRQDLQAAIVGLDQDLQATIAKLDADLRERIARLEGLIEGLRDTMTAQRGDRPDAA